MGVYRRDFEGGGPARRSDKPRIVMGSAIAHRPSSNRRVVRCRNSCPARPAPGHRPQSMTDGLRRKIVIPIVTPDGSAVHETGLTVPINVKCVTLQRKAIVSPWEDRPDRASVLRWNSCRNPPIAAVSLGRDGAHDEPASFEFSPPPRVGINEPVKAIRAERDGAATCVSGRVAVDRIVPARPRR